MAENANSALQSLSESAGVSRLHSALGSDSELALVGGCVRDALSGVATTDIDLTTRLRPEETVSRLASANIRVIETGIEHGTVLAVIDGTHYEVTTFRQPGPRVGSGYSERLETDLSGRDFTINALAFDLSSRSLIDPFRGAQDLAQNLLRAVGDAQARFEEDPLRVLRMIRFGPAAGRAIEGETLTAARALGGRLKEVSVERIRHELDLILTGEHPAVALRMMLELGLLEVTLPEVLPTVGVEQNDFHIHDVFEHTLDVIQNAPAERILRWTALFHDLGKPATLTIDADGKRHFYLHEQVSGEIALTVMERLKFSHSDIKTIRLLVDLHMRPLTCGPTGLRRLIRELGDDFDNWFLFKHADRPPRGAVGEFERDVAHFTGLLSAERSRTVGSVYDSLAIRGDDITKTGVPEGPRVGMILKALRDEVLDEPERNTREYLLQRVEVLRQQFKE